MEEGKMTKSRNMGQAIVETALVLPILLILILGGYASARTAFLKSRSESAVFAEALRAGRNLPGIERELSRSILPDDGSVDIQAGQKRKSRLLPVPSPLLAGKTTASVMVGKQWMEIGAPRWLPAAKIHQGTEFHVDCWGKESSSGKSIRRWIRGLVVLGAIR
jgi:hypothetical protein